MAGKFITFEGGEGAGKSTQIARLKDRLEKSGVDVIATREPGGTAGAEMVRSVLLSGAARLYGPEAEAVLFNAARADHVDTLIKPALEAGKWVLCDRFADSSRVYQGEAGVSDALIDQLQEVAIDGHEPDMTLLIDVPTEVGLARVTQRSEKGAEHAPDRFEQDTIETHERRRQLFLKIAENAAHRFVVIDGSQSLDAVEQAIWQAVEDRFLKAKTPAGEAQGAAENG
ncbi:dTMP kinase [Pseudovibrio exalbescens]|uniref:dTMP kinase n=1 Tax=Pseudovibrio exalbescens TaxID=197461 RepID=UPI0023659536|nr:dTMP kinase [Pseudovibrio exalbescens]MDD7908821.1 dTMP kinase [Pseudovibrio exalbescens]